MFGSSGEQGFYGSERSSVHRESGPFNPYTYMICSSGVEKVIKVSCYSYTNIII